MCARRTVIRAYKLSMYSLRSAIIIPFFRRTLMRTMTPILSLVFLASLAPACAPPPPKAAIASDAPSAPVKVATTVAETEQIPRLLPLTGTLEPNAESAVAANASGQVVRVFVERGSVVVKGAPLVQLDTRLSSLSAAEAQANLESIRTQKVQADTDCERNRRLLERQAITAVEFEKESELSAGVT